MIYEFFCQKCLKTIEYICKVAECPEKIICPCGKKAKKIISRTATHCDSEIDVKWLASARQVMQPDHERPIETRGEYKRYLRDHNLVCKG